MPQPAWGVSDLSGYWKYRTTTLLQLPEALSETVLALSEAAVYFPERHAAIRRQHELQLNTDCWKPGGVYAERR